MHVLAVSTDGGTDASFGEVPLPIQLIDHLRRRLGGWPIPGQERVIAWSGRHRPEWDGGHWPLLGVVTPTATLLSRAPDLDLTPEAEFELLRAARAIDLAGSALGRATLRWTTNPPPGDDLGIWVPVTDPRLPDWLRPFGGEALISWAPDGSVAGAVGLKRHDDAGWEVSVAVDPVHRGQGLARALVAQASRTILAAGRLPIYLHETTNLASARVAEATGFADLGWRLVWLSQDAASALTSTPELR